MASLPLLAGPGRQKQPQINTTTEGRGCTFYWYGDFSEAGMNTKFQAARRHGLVALLRTSRLPQKHTDKRAVVSREGCADKSR